MAYDARVDSIELRRAMQKIVEHARAPQGSPSRMSKEELMKLIDVLDDAVVDPDWTVYYP
jgi:hypothetical protein